MLPCVTLLAKAEQLVNEKLCLRPVSLISSGQRMLILVRSLQLTDQKQSPQGKG